jgi:hypothetical protein
VPYADPEKRREFQRKWRAANRDKLRKASLKWRTANLDKVRETNRVYREANRDKVRGLPEANAMRGHGGEVSGRADKPLAGLERRSTNSGYLRATVRGIRHRRAPGRDLHPLLAHPREGPRSVA